MLITVAGHHRRLARGHVADRPRDRDATLDRFYRRVRPGGPGLAAVSQRLGFGDDRIPGGALSWVNWVAGLAAVYCAVFAVGALLTGIPAPGRGLRGRRDRGFLVDPA